MNYLVSSSLPMTNENLPLVEFFVSNTVCITITDDVRCGTNQIKIKACCVVFSEKLGSFLTIFQFFFFKESPALTVLNSPLKNWA
jgi:hypothetical protein